MWTRRTYYGRTRDSQCFGSTKDNLEGTVYFVFQPSEENIKGALAMMDDGLFDIIDPEEMYAMHVTPSLPGPLPPNRKKCSQITNR